MYMTDLYVAECNLGEVKLEPMQSAAVHGKPCAGGSLLQGLLQGHLYCVQLRSRSPLSAIAECLFAPTPPSP